MNFYHLSLIFETQETMNLINIIISNTKFRTHLFFIEIQLSKIKTNIIEIGYYEVISIQFKSSLRSITKSINTIYKICEILFRIQFHLSKSILNNYWIHQWIESNSNSFYEAFHIHQKSTDNSQLFHTFFKNFVFLHSLKIIFNRIRFL